VNKIGPCQNALEFSHRLDPLLPFKIGPMDGRNARESGLPLKVWLRQTATVPESNCERVSSTPVVDHSAFRASK
jgi:hypothetical protein